MRTSKHLWSLMILALVMAGCDSMPGLRVLTGGGAEGNANQLVAIADLVMADKSGNTDPSLFAAADRIEEAAGNVDIIEIRQDLAENTFVVNLLWSAPQAGTPGSQDAVVAFYNSLRRAIELTWQAALPESEGMSTIQISVLDPQGIPTLDNGVSFVGFVILDSEITRQDAMLYLSGTRDLNSFLGLIINGTMTFESPESQELYVGQPNHPLFMLPALPQEAAPTA